MKIKHTLIPTLLLTIFSFAHAICFAGRGQNDSVEIFDTELYSSDFFLPGNLPTFPRSGVERILFMRTTTSQVIDSFIPVGEFYVSLEFFKNYPGFNIVLAESILNQSLGNISFEDFGRRSFLPDYSKLTPRQSVEKYIMRLTPLLALNAACFQVGQGDCYDGPIDEPSSLLTRYRFESKIYEPVGDFVSVAVLTADKGCYTFFRFHSYFRGITFNLKTKARVGLCDIFKEDAEKELSKLLAKHDPRRGEPDRNLAPEKDPTEGFILTRDGIYFPYNTFEAADVCGGEHLVRIFLPIDKIRHLLTDEAKAAYRQ